VNVLKKWIETCSSDFDDKLIARLNHHLETIKTVNEKWADVLKTQLVSLLSLNLEFLVIVHQVILKITSLWRLNKKQNKKGFPHSTERRRSLVFSLWRNTKTRTSSQVIKEWGHIDHGHPSH